MEKKKPQKSPTKFERKLKVKDKKRTRLPKHNLRNILPTIRCFCGAKILIIRDSKAMDVAIGNHLDEHRRTEKDARKAAAKRALAELNLLAQLFEFVAKLEIGY
jgi:hypothetical protein